MTDRYSLYLDNDLNRVFNHALVELAATELKILTDRQLATPLEQIDRLQQGRTAVLMFESPDDPEQVRAAVARHSAAAILFRHQPSSGEPPTDSAAPTLIPLPLDDRLTYGTELVTTQRYRGKTNERLTRAMLNLALAVAGTPASTVLDPMCGRGTTLNWALAYGLNALGIEPDRASLDQHAIFLETWAKRRRLPHKTQRYRDSNAEQRFLSFNVAPNRPAFKAGDGQQIVTFRADGADASLPIKKHSIDVIVTDLPYGVQHRGAASPKADETFDPVVLLERMLGVWRRWLRSDGAICLAWNLKQADRDAVASTLHRNGFEPVVATGGYTMRHVVDATIDRDVIVARA